MANSNTNCQLLLYMLHMSRKLRYNTAAKALLVLPRPRVPMVQSLQSSTATQKCQTQHGTVILVTKTGGQTRFIFPKEEHAEYWTADKRDDFAECCRRNVLSGGLWRLCGSKDHSTANCNNLLAKATTTNHARRAIMNNPMHPSQDTSPFSSEVEFARYAKDTGLLAPSSGVPQYLTPVAIFTLAVAVVISSMPPAIVQYLVFAIM
jgi:hypothetical protein